MATKAGAACLHLALLSKGSGQGKTGTSNAVRAGWAGVSDSELVWV